MECLLYGGFEPQFIDNARRRDRQGSIERATTGTLVAAAAKLFRYRCNIHFALATQAHA